MTATHFYSNRTAAKRKAFTLIELLVVMVIIAILAAILVPVASLVITTTKETSIITQVKQVEMAIEQYKNEFGTHPIDMTNPTLLSVHINKISRKHKYGASIFDPSDITNANTLYGGNLENPHVADFGGPAFRNMNRMDQCEAMTFFLTEISKNVDFPLGYRFDTTSGNWVYLPGDRYVFAEVPDTVFRDQDQDGWLEIVQQKGPELPLVYFDSRTYLIPVYDASWNVVDFNANAFDPTTSLFDGATYYTEAFGIAEPYWQTWDTTVPEDWPASWNEASGFQIIAPGMDGDYGVAYTRGAFESKQHDQARGNYLMSEGDLDNISSFSSARLDKEYDQ